MKDSKDISKKLFNAALLGAICVAPLVGGIAAQAAPPDHGKRGHDSSQSQSRNNNHDSKHSHDQNRGRGNNQPHTSNQSHAAPQSHVTNRSHNTYQPGTTNRSHNSYQPHTTTQSHSTYKPRTTNRSHSSYQPHTTTQSHSTYKPRTTNRSHSSYQSHTTGRAHVTPQAHHATLNTKNHSSKSVDQRREDWYRKRYGNDWKRHYTPSHSSPSSHQNWRRTNNNHYDDNWHRSHGYTRKGSKWYWRGHSDDYWINRGYGWNGSLWILLGNSHVGVAFIGNRDYDADWHRRHGYIWRGGNWYWHDHSDDYWHSRGYFWNGTIWILLNSSRNRYGSYRTYTGIVTQTYYGDNEIDIRINGRTFNVYVSTGLPYRLYRGDLVRVYGQRYGDNDIRNSSVRILRRY